jgi:DNA-binding transcriptional MerR regulator
MAVTVTQAARRCGLSRSTLLYYESIGLVRPARTASRYRSYSDADLERLRQICVYRNAGLAIDDVRLLLDRGLTDAAAVLRRRLVEIEQEVDRLRAHQASILQLLREDHDIWRSNMVTKEKWVEVMRKAGFSEEDMHRWHREFERSAPDEHQEFLEFLHIPDSEIRAIREWSAGQ